MIQHSWQEWGMDHSTAQLRKTYGQIPILTTTTTKIGEMKYITISALTCATCTYALSREKPRATGKQQVNMRRAFLAKTVTTAVTSALALGVRHGLNCNCVSCLMGVEPANAFYEREAGDETSSAVTKALNAQARLTNARLEASGFPLDSKEEEDEKIREAFKNFSYEPTSSSKVQNKGRYTGSKTAPTSKKL